MAQSPPQSGAGTRPSDFLRAAESSAIMIRKLLHSQAGVDAGSCLSGSKSDAERLTKLIERLAQRGQKVPAVEALKIAQYVEVLVDLVRAELDAYFAD